MQMHPRKYGTLNRAVARSVTYALRGYGKKPRRNNYTYVNQNGNNSIPPIKNSVALIVESILLIFVLIFAIQYPILLVLYFVLLFLIFNDRW